MLGKVEIGTFDESSSNRHQRFSVQAATSGSEGTASGRMWWLGECNRKAVLKNKPKPTTPHAFPLST